MKKQRNLLWILLIGLGLAFAFGYATYRSVKLAYKIASGDGSSGDGKSSSPLLFGFGDNKSDANIAILELDGVIMSSKDFLADLKDIEETKSVKALVIRVNSPGGAVAPSQEIYDKLLSLREKLKVVCSFDSLAASGGYYIAAGCEKIVSNPGTLTGSIGVIMPFMNLKDLYVWAKVNPFNIKSGKFKDIGSESRPMTEDERVLLQGMVSEIHAQFKAAIKKGRPQMSPDVIENYADGRIFSGAQAHALGFVDELGGEERAVALAAEMAKIEKPNPERWGEEPRKLRDLFSEFKTDVPAPGAAIDTALGKLHPLLRINLQPGVPYLLPQIWFSGNGK
jgi:protease IV